ncbi:malonyl-CoA decarboxylase [Rhizobiales bacterium GAS188]|nr:malonyl-CoA decarboxylase [Rhizobiales bacterium GAS188]
MSDTFFGDLLASIADRGRSILRLGRGGQKAENEHDLARLCEALLSGRGEASGVALAGAILSGYEALAAEARLAFLRRLVDEFGCDHRRLAKAIEAYRADPNAKAVLDVHFAAEPRRQELIRRLNLAHGGTAALVRMREDLLRASKDDRNAKGDRDLDGVDADFVHLFSSWFNPGFLVLRPIDWSTPANILEKIIRYEAVHEIGTWEDLRDRLEPPDRRCFAFFHPQLVDEPLIFVEVALTGEIPGTIGELLAEDRVPIASEEATTAVFYSISNCQEGLRGISFGNFLIKQVVETLKRNLPRLTTFVTLSPAPSFARWLAGERKVEDNPVLSGQDHAALSVLDQPDWPKTDFPAEALRGALLAAAAHYYLEAKSPSGRPLDPVARFHLGNGARLERLNWPGDMSDKGLREAHGLMVNYLYKLDDIEQNHEAFAARNEVVASGQVRRLLRKPANGRAAGRLRNRPSEPSPSERGKDGVNEAGPA